MWRIKSDISFKIEKYKQKKNSNILLIR